MEPELHRLRVAYHKGDRLAYLGHLEVLHTLERSIRRAGLPFGVSTGFARRMRVQFSQALPVGAASAGEYLDVGLRSRLDPEEALAALVASTPPALAPFAAAYVPHALPALEAWLTRASWELEIEASGLTAGALDASLGEVAAAGTINFMRGTKPRSIELATTLVSWEVRNEEPGRVALRLETRSSNRGALRPAILLDAAFGRPQLAGIERSATRIVRSAQHHETPEGELRAPFDVTES